MKTIMITASVFLVMMIGTLGYVIGLSQGLDRTIEDFKYAGYESDDTHYVNGQILLPDMIHPNDTLVVINAPYLNECLARPEVGSDGDIMEILNETTVRYSLLPNTILKQETDDRGLTSVQYIKDGEEWGLDYLTKQEYDSAFHDFVNYRQ